MSSRPVSTAAIYADFGGLESAQEDVKANDPQAIRAAAQQFESLFTDMMLKSMREAKLGQGLGDSQESDLSGHVRPAARAARCRRARAWGSPTCWCSS